MFRIIILIFVLISSVEANAADFITKGEKISSSTSYKSVICEGYELKIETEEFPFKYEGRIPGKYRIEGYYGSDSVISRKAYLVANKNISIPLANDLIEVKEKLLKGRTYLPTKAMCKGDSFVIQYWSGGNCTACEVFIEFNVSGDKLGSANLIPYSKVREKYN